MKLSAGNKLLSYILVFVTVSLAIGCEFNLESESGRDFLMTLPEISHSAASEPLFSGEAKIAYPTLSPELETDRVALIKPNDTYDYFAGAQWADVLSVLLQSNLVHNLSQNRVFERVYDDTALHDTRYLMNVTIHHFEAHYDTSLSASPIIRIDATISVYDTRQNTSVFHTSLFQTSTAKHNTLHSIYQTFRATYTAIFHDLLDEITTQSPKIISNN